MKSTINKLTKIKIKIVSTTLKNALFLFAIFMTIISCSKDDEPTSTPKAPIYLLSKIIYSATSESKLSYDENNRLNTHEQISSNGGVFKTTFIYNSNGKIIETLKKPTAGNNTTIEKQTYIYDSQNRLIEKKLYNATTSLPNVFTFYSSRTFSYDGNNVEYKFTTANNSFATKRTVLDLNQTGNFITIKGYKDININNLIGVLDYSTSLEYDDKKSSLSSLPDEYIFPEKTKNNRTKSTTLGSNPSVANILYEYNQDGFPTKSIFENDTTTFEYIIK